MSAHTTPSALCTIGLIALAAVSLWFAWAAPGDISLWIGLAILAAAIVSSVAGFAFSAICGAMLFHLIDDSVQAVQIMMICSVGGQSIMVWMLRHEIVWRALPVFLAGAALGLPVGLFFLLYARPVLYAHAVGVFLVVYAVFMIVRPPLIVRRQHMLFDAVAGFLGGVTGGAAAFPGAFVTIWCSFKGWPKERQRGVYQPFILIVQLAAISVMTLPGLTADQVYFDFSGVAYLPAMMIGVTLGMLFFNRLNDRQFALVVNLLLIVSGLSFLV